MLLPYVILAFIFVIGLCVGSFLNVVILRALSNESIVFPASKCPKCQKPLKWWHNIPVLSYIFLRGKCAYCKERISIQYPIVELLTGIIFTLVFIKYGFRIDTLFIMAISSLLIVLAGTDIKEKVIFEVHAYILIGIILLYALLKVVLSLYGMHNPVSWSVLHNMTLLHNPLTSAIVGALAGVLIMELVARLGCLLVGTRAFGEGDTFIAAGLGAFFGWKGLLCVLAASILIQIVLFIPMFIKGLIENKDWKTLITFLAFTFYSIGLCVLQVNQIITEGMLFIVMTLVLAFLGLLASKFILEGLKERPENRTYLPFGPAMVISAFVFLLLG